jgi:hypothetical protein
MSAPQETSSQLASSGPDVTILKIFSPKNLTKILAFFAHTTAFLHKNVIETSFFEKNAIFSPKIADNCDKNIDPWTYIFLHIYTYIYIRIIRSITCDHNIDPWTYLYKNRPGANRLKSSFALSLEFHIGTFVCMYLGMKFCIQENEVLHPGHKM